MEVARMAGVSQSSVSRAYTPGASVSPQMAEKVRQAADHLGYRPNVLARSLITGTSRIIGLVVGHFENHFHPSALELLSRELKKNGYHILVFLAPNEESDTEEIVADLLDYQVDGLIAASVAMTVPLASRCRAEGIPAILFNRHQGEDGPTSVASDNFDGARRVAHFLVAGGHQRIAHISGWRGSSTGREREDGFRAGLKDFDVALATCADGRYSRSAAAEACRSIFARGCPAPDAIFVGGDHMAFAVIDTLKSELGIRVPEDVSVVGFDDVPLAAWPSYSLTTMRQPLERMVEATVGKLLEAIDQRNTPPVHLRFPCSLMLRGSARLPEDRRHHE